MHALLLLAATALSVPSEPAYAQEDQPDALEGRLGKQQKRIQQLEAMVVEPASLLPRACTSVPVSVGNDAAPTIAYADNVSLSDGLIALTSPS